MYAKSKNAGEFLVMVRNIEGITNIGLKYLL
jgi:hypothetical protein